MKTKSLSLPSCIALLSFAFVGAAAAADTNSALEKALRDADAQWSAAAEAKDLDKTVSFYSADAIVLPPNTPAVTNKDGIREMWKGFLDSVTSISWKATRVEVAKSGDMAYVTGTYETIAKEAGGGSPNDRGKYLEVWEKQPDGSWKCGADMFSSDLAAPGEKK